MTDFDKWYKKENPDLNQASDFSLGELQRCFEAGAASQAESETAREVLEMMDEERMTLSKLNRITTEDERVRAEGGLASKMTLLEHYAGQALLVLVHEGDMGLDDVASLACSYAEAMIKALKAPDEATHRGDDVHPVEAAGGGTVCAFPEAIRPTEGDGS
jgi:hypothetical protein